MTKAAMYHHFLNTKLQNDNNIVIDVVTRKKIKSSPSNDLMLMSKFPIYEPIYEQLINLLYTVSNFCW